MERVGGTAFGNSYIGAGKQDAAENVYPGLDFGAAHPFSVAFIYRDGDSDHGVWNLWIWVRCAGLYLWRILG